MKPVNLSETNIYIPRLPTRPTPVPIASSLIPATRQAINSHITQLVWDLTKFPIKFLLLPTEPHGFTSAWGFWKDR